MPGPTGVQGLQGFVNQSPEADPFTVHGGPVNPAHGSIGEQATPYSWEAFGGAMSSLPHGPYGAENELLGDSPQSRTFQSGTGSQNPEFDATPYRTHAAPWPKGVESSVYPDAVARQLIQSRDIHASNTGASNRLLYSQGMLAKQDNWVDFYTVEPGEDNLPVVPSAIGFQANGYGVKDHTSNPMAARNQFGFDSAHKHRRYAVGSIPGNYMWMKPGGRPMVKSLPGPARPATGADSPFRGDDTTASFTTQGAILNQPPFDYTAPPAPITQSSPQSGDAPPPAIALW